MGNHPAQNLRGALADGEQARVAVHTLDGKLLAVAIATKDLNGITADPLRDFRGVEFRHGSGTGDGQPPIFQPGGLVDREPCGADPHLHVGDHVGHGLVGANRPPKGFTLTGVTHGGVVGALRQTQRHSADADTSTIEHFKELDEALPTLTKQIVAWYPDAIQEYRSTD